LPADSANRFEPRVVCVECVLRGVAGNQIRFVTAEEFFGKNHQFRAAIGGNAGQFDRFGDVGRDVAGNRLRLRSRDSQ
jgi:hypothetical protein